PARNGVEVQAAPIVGNERAADLDDDAARSGDGGDLVHLALLRVCLEGSETRVRGVALFGRPAAVEQEALNRPHQLPATFAGRTRDRVKGCLGAQTTPH